MCELGRSAIEHEKWTEIACKTHRRGPEPVCASKWLAGLQIYGVSADVRDRSKFYKRARKSTRWASSVQDTESSQIEDGLMLVEARRMTGHHSSAQ